MDVVQERHAARQSVELHVRSERVDGDQSATREQVRYDWL